MTRIGFMSDLHLDSNQFGEDERMQLLQVLQEEQIEHLHLAGDISNDFKQISLPFIQDLQRQFPVSFNLGNHDMLSLSEEEIKQLQNKRKKLISQQKQEERKKRDRRLYEKGAVFESIFTESKDFTKDEFYQLITFPKIKEEVNQKIRKIIEKREQTEEENIENQEEEMNTEE